jgi:hypothetical protein
MLDKTRDEIAQFLRQHKTAHLALSGPDGPWASIVRFISAGLILYLMEPQASDLVFYIENDPQVVLCIDRSETDPERYQQLIVQIFGVGRILGSHEFHHLPDDVRKAYDLKNGQLPGVYVVIEVRPWQVYRVIHTGESAHRDTIDLDDFRSGSTPGSV